MNKNKPIKSILIEFVGYLSVCYNYKVKFRLLTSLCLLIFLALPLLPQIHTEEQNINDFIIKIRKSLELKDLPTYLESFSSDIRLMEEASLKEKFNLYQAESIALFPAGQPIRTGDRTNFYVQALFQNSFSVAIETWRMSLVEVDGQYQIEEKKVTGSLNSLYKINIPSERIEQVQSIEIEHRDIKLVFKDACVFYDNIPDIETALVVIGKGYLWFSPSDDEERHQLKLTYKKNILEDELTYAFLRISDYFFRNNIKITRGSVEKKSYPSQEDMDQASAIFSRHYYRAFTVENSLNGEMLSSLPRGDEAFFGFYGNKIGNLSYIYSPFAEEEIHLVRFRDDRIINLYSPRNDDNKKMFFISFSQMFEIKKYQIELSFNPKQHFLSAKARVEFESKVDSLGRLKLKLNPKLKILRICDEEGRQLFYSQDKLRDALYVYFLQSPPNNKPYSIEIFYRGKVAPIIQVTDVVAGAQVVQRFPGRFDPDADLIPPQSETYLYSRRNLWYPAPAQDDYFQARVKISLPGGYQCESIGELIEQPSFSGEKGGEAERSETSVYVFETRYPVKYLSFIVGRFKNAGEDVEILPLKYIYSSGVNFIKKDLLEEARNILHFYEEKFGPYPYEKLNIIRRLWTTSGGHSPASFVVLNELPRAQNGSVLINVRSPVDLSHWKEYFIAHEIAHQWWGQAVTWKTYHDLWLSEGLAQFSATLYLGQRHGEQKFSTILEKFSVWTKKVSKYGPITLGSRLSYHSPKAFQAIVYDKTSLALNMLKDLLGEEQFFRGMKTFFSRYKYGAAGTQDFIKTMEEVSGRDLRTFFKSWFYSYTLPEVKAYHSFTKGKTGPVLRLKFSQMKKVFVFPLWIEWRLDGERIKRMVIIDEKNEEFEFKLETKPKKIKINPDRAVPGRFY